MKRTIKLFIYWILIYILIAISLVVFVENRRSTSNSLDKYANVQKYVGKRLEFINLLNRDSNIVQLETSNEFTLIDFWYRGCGPCIKEMKGFNSLISGLETRINIISISIDGSEVWYKMFQNDSPFSFLTKETINWKHYNLTDSTYLTADKEYIARGSGLNFTNELGLISFPSYLVLDKNGVLIDLPNSGVDYIRKKIYNQSDFRVFWTSPQMRDSSIKMFFGAFMLYSLIYWLTVLIILLKKRHKRKYCC